MDTHTPRLSLDLLQTLELLLRTRSVTRTAELLGQSQPGISAALRRLRDAFDDPLLVRSGTQLVPTARAAALEPRIKEILQEFNRLLTDGEVFDPNSCDYTFHLAAADCMQIFLAPKFISALREESSKLHVAIHPLAINYSFVKAMEEGELDIVIGNWPKPPENLRYTKLFREEMVCIRRRQRNKDHANQRLSLDDYLKMDHLAPQPYLTNADGPVDGALNSLGLRRRIAVTIPDFNMAGHIAAESDLVFTCNRRFGEYFSRMLDLELLAAPKEFPPMTFYALWHDCNHRDKRNEWLRAKLHGITNQFNSAEKSAPTAF